MTKYDQFAQNASPQSGPSREPEQLALPFDDEPRCPRCGETALIDYDEHTDTYTCRVCAHSWRPIVEGPRR